MLFTASKTRWPGLAMARLPRSRRSRRGASSEEIHISFSCNSNRIVKIPDSIAHIRPSRPAGWVPETWRC